MPGALSLPFLLLMVGLWLAVIATVITTSRIAVAQSVAFRRLAALDQWHRVSGCHKIAARVRGRTTLTYRNFSNSLHGSVFSPVGFVALARSREQFLDLRGKPRMIGLDGALECGDLLPRPVEQVLMKVPTRRFAGLGGELTE